MSLHPAPEPHPLEGKLEAECRDVQTPLECAALSIAISLKRIADQLEGQGSRPGMIEMMSYIAESVSVRT